MRWWPLFGWWCQRKLDQLSCQTIARCGTGGRACSVSSKLHCMNIVTLHISAAPQLARQPALQQQLTGQKPVATWTLAGTTCGLTIENSWSWHKREAAGLGTSARLAFEKPACLQPGPPVHAAQTTALARLDLIWCRPGAPVHAGYARPVHRMRQDRALYVQARLLQGLPGRTRLEALHELQLATWQGPVPAAMAAPPACQRHQLQCPTRLHGCLVAGSRVRPRSALQQAGLWPRMERETARDAPVHVQTKQVAVRRCAPPAEQDLVLAVQDQHAHAHPGLWGGDGGGITASSRAACDAQAWGAVTALGSRTSEYLLMPRMAPRSVA